GEGGGGGHQAHRPRDGGPSQLRHRRRARHQTPPPRRALAHQLHVPARTHASRPYVTPGASYETYRAAYQYGWESYRRHRGRPFEEVESELRREWERTDRELSWASARGASRDAWQRVDEQRPVGDRSHR